MKQLILSFTFILVLVSQSAAQDLAKGVSAFENKEYDLAIVELLPLAEIGNARAQSLLGLIHTVEYPPNYIEAEKWNRLAASQGIQDAQFMLAYAYKEGRGVEQSNRTAHVWFNIAAMYGDVQAASERDSVEKLLTSYQRSKAMSDALVCVGSEFEVCP